MKHPSIPFGFRHECKAPSSRLLAALREYRLPHVIKTMEDGQPCHKPLPVTLDKRDRFWRVNGRVISQNLALHLLRMA